MKTPLLPRLFLLLAFFIPCAAFAGDNTVNADVSVIALPRDQSLLYTSSHDLQKDPAGAFKDLLKMVEQKTAESAANASVTTKSGQRAISENSVTSLEVEPVLSPAGDAVDVNLALTCDKNKITTSVIVKPGDMKYLGSFDSASAGKNTTCLVFLRVTTTK